MPKPELRPMDVGDILDVTFRLYRARFVQFVTIALVVYVPLAVVNAFFQLQVQSLEEGGPMRPEEALPVLGALCGTMMLVLFLALVFGALCSGALVHNISSAYLGEELGSWESYVRAAPRLLRLLGAQIVVSLAVMVGLFLCVVPGIIFMLWFWLIAPVVMLEDRGAIASLERSRELMRGNLGKGFVLLLVVFLLTAAIQGAIAGVLYVVLKPYPFFHYFVQNVLQAFVVPIQLAPAILMYYDLRIRKEAFDLEQLAAGLGRPAEA